MIKSILIIGGSGYLGRHLYPNLVDRGYNVTITSTGKSNVVFTHRVEHIKINFSNEDTFWKLKGRTYDLVLILSATINGIGDVDLSNKDLEINVFGLKKFLSFLQKNQISTRYIYTSSMTVYSDINISPVKENDLLQPINVYGLSKLMAENLFSFFCRQNNFSGVIVRLPGLYGGDRKGGVIYNVIETLKKDDIFILQSNGLGFWETIYIEDVSILFQNFLDSYLWKKNIDTYNFSYGKEIDFYDTVLKIGVKLKKVDNIKIDKKKDYKRLFLSNRKIRSLFDVTINFEDSLNKYIEIL